MLSDIATFPPNRAAAALLCALTCPLTAATEPTASPDAADLDRIQALAREHGVAAYPLAEAWVALGFRQSEAGRHADAVKSFESALHIERVHRGLHDPAQITLLERMAESNRALGDWPAVAQNYRLMQWINARGRAPGDPERAALVSRLTRWHLEAADLPTGQAPFDHLRAAADLAAEAVTLSERHRGDDAAAVIDALVLRAAAAHRIAHHMSTWVGEPVKGVRPEAIATAASLDASDYFFRQNFVISNYAAGREALQRAVELAAASGDPARHARCEQLLGDWHLLFGRKHAAADHYDRAQALSRTAKLDLFARPRRLPNFVEPLARRPAADAGPQAFVRTRFDIDAQGRARNVEILEVTPQGSHVMARQAREQLRGMRFRPRFQDGKAVKSKGVEIRIVFPRPTRPGAAVKG